MIVHITAAQPVRYSLNNGFSMTEFAPGEHYSVPDYAGRGMIERGWAEQTTADTAPTQPQAEPAPAPAAEPSGEEPPQKGRPRR